jgi:CDP-paratose 2-epimerase
MPKVIITGSSGLIGAEAVRYFDSLGWTVAGLDNDGRKEFFGPDGSTAKHTLKLIESTKNFKHFNADIRDKHQVDSVFANYGDADLVVHFAAQPSHDYSWNYPLNDFRVNALGTMHVLEATRTYSPNAVFIYTSTSKVYGTHVNNYRFKELETRFDYESAWMKGVDETCPIDQDTIHSLFGASKLAGDLMVQEYGNYFGLKTAILRPGCMTGSGHAGVELHGFLSYLIKCICEGKTYNVFDDLGGKRVRDNIHSYDVVRACMEIYLRPPKPGTVFNLGGGRENSISIIEALALASYMAGKPALYEITNHSRVGDHIVYITDQAKFKKAYPNWGLTYDLPRIFQDIIDGR